MASVLEQQLQRIAKAAGLGGDGGVPSQKGKASLVYSFREASDVGVEDLYETGVRGFEQLCRLEPRFQSCRELLFSRQSLSFDCHDHTNESIVPVKLAIERFCGLLGPYFLLPASTHALEYLVRKFEIHEYNVDAIMRAALPYHGTNEFVRCVQIMSIEGTCFAFLHPMKKSGAVLSRDQLVERCKTDQALLRFVCEMARDLADPSIGARNVMGWYAAVVCELIDSLSVVGEDFLGFILPYIMHGTRRNVVIEYRDATYMILAQLSSRATLSHHVLTGLVSNIALTCSPNSMPQVLLLLAYLASSQEKFVILSNDSFRSLSRLPNLISELSVMTKRVQQSHQFAGMVAAAAMEGILIDGDIYEIFINLISSVDLGNFVSIVSSKILDVTTRAPSGQDEIMENLVKAIQAFDDQYGKEMESKINEFLQGCDAASPERQKVLSVLEKALENSVRAPLLDANVTLGTGVDSASSSVRIMALEKLDAIVQSASGDIKEDSELILKTALTRRLQDEDMHVVNTVLNLKSLHLLAKEILLENLVQCIDNAMLLLNSKELSKKQSKVAMKNVQQALALLCEQFPDECDAILLSLLLCTKTTRKISVHVLGLYVSSDRVFSAFFKDIYHQLEKQASHTRTGEEKSSKPESPTFDVREYNDKIVDALGSAILQNKDARSESLRLISHSNSHHSPQVLLYRAMETAMKAKEKKYMKACQEISSTILALFSMKDVDAIAPMEIGKEGSGSIGHVNQLASRSIHISHLEPDLLLVALEAAKENGSQQTLLENANALFVKLASLESNIWSPHLQLMLKKLPDALIMLDDIWSPFGCAEDGNDKVRMVALQSWAKILATEKLPEKQRSLAASRIPNLLAVLAHPDVKMRKSGIEAANTLMESLGKWWPNNVSNIHLTKELANEIFKLCRMYSERIIGDSDGIEYVLYSILCDSTSKPMNKSGQGESYPSLGPILSSEMRVRLSDYFLFELRDADRAHGTANIPLLLAILHDSTKIAELQEVGAIIMENLFLKQTDSFPILGDGLERSSALEIIKIFNDPSIPKPTDSKASAKVLNVLLKAASWKGETALRSSALLSLSRWGGPGSDVGDAQEIYQVLMLSAVQDTEEACRTASHKALETMTINAEIIRSLLDLSTTDGPASSRRKKGPKSQDINLNALLSSLPKYLCILDFLQWRKGISSVESLIEPIQNLIKGLVQLSESNQELDNEEVEASGPAQVLYALQLALNVLLVISDRSKEENEVKFDISLIVKCASSVSDHAVRTSALDVLRSRIVANPTDALSYVMQAIQVIGDITSTFSDKYSTMLAVQTISAATAAWIDGGHSMNELVPEVIKAIKSSELSKRYTILVSIIESVSSKSSETVASVCYNLLKGDENIHDDDWKMEAASTILTKISPETCISGFSLMLLYCIDDFAQHGDTGIMLRTNAVITQSLKKYSGYLRHELQGDLISSYDLIMQYELKEIQIIGRLRANSSDPKLQLVEDNAYAVVEQMEEIMDAGDFISALVRVISHEDSDDSIKRRGFYLLSKSAKSLADANLETLPLQQPIHEIVGIIVSIVQERSSWTDLTRQSALDALSCLIKKLGSRYPDVFLQAVPATVDLVNQQEMPAVQGMGLICICSFIRSMQESITPMIPQIISATLSGLKFAVEESEEAATQNVTLCTSLAALEALATNLAPFLSPVLHDILALLLRKNIVRSSDTECVRLSKSCRSIISSNVPSRLLIGPLSALFGTSNVEDPRSTQALLQILCGCIMQMDSSSIAVYHVSVFSMLLTALDTRRTRMDSLSSSDVKMLENETVHCIVELTLKLNEGKFKTLFYRLVEWAMSNPEGETQEDTVSVERRISLFHVVIALTENLKSVFTPYFKLLQDPITKSLSVELPQPSEPAPKPKRGRKGKVAEKDAEKSREINKMRAVATLKMVSVQALVRCFMYDTTGFLDEARFETFLPHILRQFEQIQDDEKVLSGDDAVTEDKLVDAIISSEAKHELGMYAQTLLACITQMATASGHSETRWRPLHHSILLLTRSSVPETRLLALESTMAICTALQEEYLPLLPEALPFLSELLEDEEEIIESRTVHVLKQMEELSGEDLKQYLSK